MTFATPSPGSRGDSGRRWSSSTGSASALRRQADCSASNRRRYAGVSIVRTRPFATSWEASMTDVRTLLERGYADAMPAPDGFERMLRRRDRKRRNQRIAAGVVGIAVFVAAVWIVTSGASSERTQEPADRTTVNRTAAAEDVVRGFVAAFGAFDAQTAMTYVAEGADLTWLIDRQVPPNADGLAAELALLRAQRFQLNITRCDAVPFGSATSVVCGFGFDAIASDQLGRGPFTDGTFVFTVRNGEIVKGSWKAPLGRFRSQMRVPFAVWVAAIHPGDFTAMYETGSIPASPEAFGRLT